LPWLPSSLQVTPSRLAAPAFDLVPHDLNGKQLFVESIGGEKSSVANAYGEESPNVKAYGEESLAANDCVKLFLHASSTSLHLDPGGYCSGTLALAQAGSHSHGFVLLISALSSKETIGHQHPLLLHCTAMHSTQHGNGVFEIPKCSKFFKAPNLIDHVLFHSLHGVQVSGDLPVTAASITMAEWISGEMDAVLSSTFETQKHSHEVPYWKMGSKASGTMRSNPRSFPSLWSKCTAMLSST